MMIVFKGVDDQNQFFNFLQIVVCKLNYKPNCFLQSTMSGV